MNQSASSPSEPQSEEYRLLRRFDRMGRLVGDESMRRLRAAHVMVIGIGGVGSWTAESIVRSGVGRVTLVDFDEICITNFNRQLHALEGLVGTQKAAVMAERLRQINPQADIRAIPKFFNAETCAEIFAERPDMVVDAVDSVTPKCLLLSFCKREGIPVVCSTGSAGKLDPTRIAVADLADTDVDPLARSVRRILRAKFAFPSEGPFGIPAVYSTEPAAPPHDLAYDNGKGFRCVCPKGHNEFFNCDERNLILGSASFVTGAFGLVCASVVVRQLIGTPPADGEKTSASTPQRP